MIATLLIIVAGWFRHKLAAIGIFVAAMAIHVIFIEPRLSQDLPLQDERASLIYSTIILAVLSLIFYGFGAGIHAGWQAWKARSGDRLS
jgi:hypothetical protein